MFDILYDLTGKFILSDINGRGSHNGLYIQAFARGLEQVLKPYQQTLVRLEAEVSMHLKIYLFDKFTLDLAEL